MFSSGRLKSLRETRGISQKELAESIGVSDVMISMYEQGKKNPSLETISKIAKYFNVTVDYLLGKELTAKDERDIAKDLTNIMNKLSSGENGPINFNGVEMSEETKELFKDELGLMLRRLKVINKEKYNPKKGKR